MRMAAGRPLRISAKLPFVSCAQTEPGAMHAPAGDAVAASERSATMPANSFTYFRTVQ